MKRHSSFAATLSIAMMLAWASHSAGLPASPSSRSTHATDVTLVRVTTTLLEESQFSHHPLDRELAKKWLDHYLDGLDSRHSLFLQPDVEEFAKYQRALSDETAGEAETSAAQRIFARFLERLEQQTNTMTAALKSSTFDFRGHDSYRLDWEHTPRPRDLAAAKVAWREQLRAEYLQEKLADKKPSDIVHTLARRHALQLKTMAGLSSDEILQVYLNALAHVYDPHSNYLSHEEMENMSISMNLSLFGIGASLQTIDGYCTIHELIPGGPGARSGQLKPGDRIIAVRQAKGEPIDVVDIPLTRTVQMIRGPKGTRVTLTILPAGAAEGTPPKAVTLVRDQIKLEDQAAKATIVDLPNGNTTLRLGIIDLPSFYANIGDASKSGQRSATADVRRLLTKLNAEHVRGLALDLRRNGGGSLEEAISLTGLFIAKGPVVQTRDLRGKVEVESDDDPAELYQGPLAILTTRFSASASEILAGALQDYGRAIVVGDSSTFGKGTVQSIVPLGPVMDENHLPHSYDPGALLITIRKFYRPSGASTQLRGVAADIVLPSLSDLSDVSESSLQDPLPWDQVAPASYHRLNEVQPFLAELRQASAQRVQREKGFSLLADAVARVKKAMASKMISLNEQERRDDIARSKALETELKAESQRLARAQPLTYEITLANAGHPGLPAPAPLPMAAEAKAEAISPPAPEAAEAADDLAGDSTGHTPADTIILGECERILADYVKREAATKLSGGSAL
ncbi:MAG: carboxy terminal-processing peptidase [Polyangia bacterium]|jgi:carboxyl-terminal processing protease